MIVVNRLCATDEPVAENRLMVELPYDLRKKSRLRVFSRCGREIGIQLPRGSELLDGQRYTGDAGVQVQIVASPETVSTARCHEPLLMLRACYHLGNRHVPLQITEKWLRYQHDHVLDEMVAGLGLAVLTEEAPFQPESGAYHRHGNSGDHGHHH